MNVAKVKVRVGVQQTKGWIDPGTVEGGETLEAWGRGELTLRSQAEDRGKRSGKRPRKLVDLIVRRGGGGASLHPPSP